VTTWTETLLVARLSHAPQTKADVIDAANFETCMLETAVRTRDKAKAMVIDDAISCGHEGDLAAGAVGGAQA
jgi:hypothetical protein